ncbi:TPM domain-containing protein [Olivibacter sp. SDN3]|uniref:TPM domain-containing protein n=1 Tax=Olivibacter sp. SDN3 TaxID=2764720 RepID=UPI00165135AF|nr:TPM domain-containing protein [Olivibacter sp. SDN3]QNL50687.1 TPM domain-containing protein [Olivibacter sp. SDN3]
MIKATHFLFLSFVLLLPLNILRAQDFPPRANTLVTDFTNTLSNDERQQLENKLVAFDDSSSTQIAVVVMTSVGDYDIADYGVRLAQQWGIGTKSKDNGILLLVAKNDRKVTIQTGYGVEGAVPDAIAFQIIRNIISPAFRGGNYYQGLDGATDALIAYTKGEFKANPKKGGGRGGAGGLIATVIIFAVIISLISSKGGGKGGGGQVIGGRGSSDLFWMTLLGSAMGRSSRGRGGFGGGGFGGGGSFGGGGGFGGFGGGGFGGGGASGSW